MRNLLFSVVLLAVLTVAAGCDDSCTDNQNALPLAGFFTVDSDGKTQNVSVDSLEVRGIGAPEDSVLSPGSVRKSEIYLPFRIDVDRTAYIFNLRGEDFTVSDTVTFDYSRVARFASAECGVSYVYHIHDISCTGLLIDSVTCPTGFIDNANIENLKIYFHSR